VGLSSSTKKEISCRVTRTLLTYVREMNGYLGGLLDGLDLDESYLIDTNNWVSHAFLHVLYARMMDILGDKNAVYKMNLAGTRLHPLGLLDWIARLLGNPRLIYMQAPKYNRLLKANGDVFIHASGDSWVLLEDRYHDSGQKTRLDCDYTRGVLAAIPTIYGMPMADVEEIECQVAAESYGNRVWPDRPVYGAKGCLYKIRWNPKQRPPLWNRVFNQYSVYRKAIHDLEEANRVIQEKYDEARNLAFELETANRQLTKSKQQLESYAAELKTTNRQLQEFAFVASHDLSEPLRKVQTFGDLLKAKSADRLDEQSRDYISRMTGAASRMKELLDALLRYSRVEIKGQEFKLLRLNDIAKDAAADLEVAIQGVGARVEIGPLPIIKGNPYQWRQMFQSLIGNAAKYHRSEVKLFIRIYAEESGGECHIFVEDNGIGFEEKYLDKIFQPFQRLHGKHEYSGTGIGLAICKKIVERHGGTITARSTPTKGSTFIVTLPVSQDKEKS
jgi:signal transduction histidine kinase